MIRGQVIFVGPVEQGIGKNSGKEWKKQVCAIQTDGQYPKKVAFSIMGDRIAQASIQMGHTIEIDVDAQSREYNGRWYTELTAYRINNLSLSAPAQVQPAPIPQPVYQQQAPQGFTAAPAVNPFGPTSNDNVMF